MTRRYTNLLLEMYDDNLLDRRELIRNLLMWMDESEVAEFYDKNYSSIFDEDEEEDAEAEDALNTVFNID